MHPMVISILVILVLAAVYLYAGLLIKLSSMPPLSKRHRNSRRFHCLNAELRKTGISDWFGGRPDYQAMLTRLPATLEELDVSQTDISSLPVLPPGLKRLRAHNCRNLVRVENLPDTLEVLDMWTCPMLAHLPERLPPGLKKLFLVDTALQAVGKLPATLEVFDARCSKELASISAEWPHFQPHPYGRDGLHWINLSGTKALASLEGNLPRSVLTELRREGVVGWRYNEVYRQIQYANQPVEPCLMD